MDKRINNHLKSSLSHCFTRGAIYVRLVTIVDEGANPRGENETFPTRSATGAAVTTK